VIPDERRIAPCAAHASGRPALSLHRCGALSLQAVDSVHGAFGVHAKIVDVGEQVTLRRRLFADPFDLPQRDVEIVGGEKSRHELLELRGITPELLRARVPGAD
jgi:hypothetical protein